MLGVNAVFAAYEIAVASISRHKLETLSRSGTPGAAASVFMKEHMEGSLALVQLAITLAGTIAAATGGTGVGEYLVPYLENEFAFSNATSEIIGIVLFVLPLSVFTIIFSELVPKMFAIENNEAITLALSPAMRLLYGICYPLIRVFEKAVRVMVTASRKVFRIPAAGSEEDGLAELWAATAHARSRNIISAFEEKMANSAVLFSRKTVADVMVPAKTISCIVADASLSDALIRAHMDMHTRFPVVGKDGNMDTVLGYLNFKDIVTALKINPANPTVRGITRPIKRIAADMPISRALQEMMAENAHMAIVLEGTAVKGIVTLEDIIEMLVGKITDEYDGLPVYIHNSGSSLIVGGGTMLSDLYKVLNLNLELPDTTLSNWARERLGKPMRGGDIVRASEIEVWIRKTRRQQLLEAIVMRRKN
ncbi:MAG: hemolysin family protein [Elusimicrobiaceae bacterium]|nr:hemolysin family protein [Elusimicrobiaceae bacterium]